VTTHVRSYIYGIISHDQLPLSSIKLPWYICL